MKQVNLEQGTPEWKKFRATHLGASEISIILGLSKWSTQYTLWQRKLGFINEQADNPAMKRGRDLEPVALALVNEKLSCNFKPAVIVHDELSWASASLDGLDLEKEAILEIKCPNKDDHALAEEGMVPKHYRPQLQWQLFVSGLEKGFYASYRNEQLAIVEVEFDEGFIIDTALEPAAAFYACLRDMIEPEISPDDYVQINDEQFSHYASEWKLATNQAKIYSDKEKYFKDKLISFTDDSNCKGFGVKLKRIEKEGSVDWKKLWSTLIKEFPEVEEFYSPEDFKKEQIGYWKVSKD